MPDSEIPVVLAYNMSHYESMEPCSDSDMNNTRELVKAYKEGRYRYTRQDIPKLISLQTVSRAQTIEEAEKVASTQNQWLKCCTSNSNNSEIK